MKKNRFANFIKKAWLWALLVIVTAGVVMGITFYTYKVRMALLQDSLNNLTEINSHGAESLTTFIGNDVEQAKRLAAGLGDISSADGAASYNILSKATEKNQTLIITVLDGENAGRVITGIDGEMRSADDGRLAAVAAAIGDDESGVTLPENNPYINTDSISSFCRFTYSDGAHAVIYVTRTAEELVNKFCAARFGAESYTCIVTSSGDVVLGSAGLKALGVNNVFSSIYDENRYDRDAINAFKANLNADRSDAARFIFRGGNYVFAGSAVGETKGWQVISIVPQAEILTGADKIVKLSLIFGSVVGSLLVLMIIIIMIVRHNRTVLAQKERDAVCREQLFSMIASKTDDVFIMLSDDYSVQYVSPNSEHVLGIHTKDILHNIKVLGNARYAKNQSVSFAMLERMRVGTSLEFEAERVHKISKERRFYVETVYRTEIEGEHKYAVTISDRTKELMAKQGLEEALNIAKVSNQSKSTFLANMSHDIRTPMNAIVGLGTLLENDSDNPEKVREHTEHLEMSSKHLMDIINNILDMSMLESSSTTLNIGEVNLSELINEIDEAVRPQSKAKNQNFNIVVAVKENNLMADRAIIRRVMLNILTNAVRYTAEGGRIDFSVRQMARAMQGYVRLQFVIKDNGIGMSEKYIKRIFEPFSRELNDINKELQGTGLGLSIAKNLVELMGGTISVDSKQGSGTTFTVNLRLQLKVESDSEDFFSAHGIGRMLVVGCNDADSRAIINAIHREDVSVSFAPNLPSALGMLDKANRDGNVFNVVLLDWQATDVMERINTVNEIRDRLPALTPIVAMVEDRANSRSDFAVAGVHAFIKKPFDLVAFKDCLNVRKSKKNKEDFSGKTVLYGMHFLAAEDNELNSMILVELLKTMGATCKVAPNGKEVLDEFLKSEKGEYGAILMDIQMPVMDGYTATREIRASGHPDAENIPIIAMTANAYSDDVQNSLNAGMNDHIVKPINMERLESIIEEIKKKN